jgi:hypothetical protein
MLWQAEDMSALERQVAVSDDVELLTWWARACEASGNYAQAISCYQRAGGAGCVQPCGAGTSSQSCLQIGLHCLVGTKFNNHGIHESSCFQP